MRNWSWREPFGRPAAGPYWWAVNRSGLRSHGRGENLPDLHPAIGVHSGLSAGPPRTFPLRSSPRGKVTWQPFPGPTYFGAPGR